MTGYVRKFEGNTTMSFKISNKQLLKKYNQIWERLEKFDSKPVYGHNDKYIKTKIKIHKNSMIVKFSEQKYAKRKSTIKCLSIIMLDSVIKAKKSISSNTFGKMQI